MEFLHAAASIPFSVIASIALGAGGLGFCVYEALRPSRIEKVTGDGRDRFSRSIDALRRTGNRT